MKPNVYVAECELGKGLFAAKDFKKGEYILTFEGTLISFEQTAKGEYEGNPLQIDYNAYIDLQDPCRSANHSCSPNSGIIKSNVLIAIKDIFKDEEIRFDYSTTMSENNWTMVCRCGSKKCRGIIKDFHLLPKDVQKQYLKLGIVQEFIVREIGQMSKASKQGGLRPSKILAKT
ncbi:MAG: hypothetical protein HZB79_10120 [Deltaproteobacteria bacterium]|nr:hypothetical protein [Deltaproteobacteria bacterium]